MDPVPISPTQNDDSMRPYIPVIIPTPSDNYPVPVEDDKSKP
jgi:hypothetical protein